ncbi:hypothetical protein V5O48_018069 [Marasmius crinis-equi]|uniref:Uncharacterized protein n=1 Tax=Marasmius crinis-equi TaxID=585013 RepID=A0ABR3EM90_9AGAR
MEAQPPSDQSSRTSEVFSFTLRVPTENAQESDAEMKPVSTAMLREASSSHKRAHCVNSDGRDVEPEAQSAKKLKHRHPKPVGGILGDRQRAYYRRVIRRLCEEEVRLKQSKAAAQDTGLSQSAAETESKALRDTIALLNREIQRQRVELQELDKTKVPNQADTSASKQSDLAREKFNRRASERKLNRQKEEQTDKAENLEERLRASDINQSQVIRDFDAVKAERDEVQIAYNSKVEELKSMGEKLREAEIRLTSHLAEGDKIREDFETRFKNLQEDNVGIKEALETARSMPNLKEHDQAHRNDVAELTGQLRSKISELESALADRDQHAQTIQECQAQSEQKITTLSAELQDAKEQIEKKTSELSWIQYELEKATSECDEQRSRVEVVNLISFRDYH